MRHVEMDRAALACPPCDGTVTGTGDDGAALVYRRDRAHYRRMSAAEREPERRESRFLCDEMLVRLGRWVRSAGYDTLIAPPGTADRQLLATALAEDRLVITCDRALAERRGARERVVVLAATHVAAQARELARRCGLDWLHRPFSRCLVDNAALAAADRHLPTAPAAVRANGGPFLACPDCGRLYWRGSHHRRMLRQLREWQGEREAVDVSDGAAPRVDGRPGPGLRPTDASRSS